MVHHPSNEDMLFITSSMSVGGAQRVISTLANNFAKNGCSVHVITTSFDIATYPLHGGVQYTHLACKTNNKLARYFERSLKIRFLIREYRPKAIITFQMHYGIFSAIGLKSKKIISLRNDPANDLKWTLTDVSLRILRYFSFLLADSIVFQTESAKNYFGNRIKKKGVIIPNPISKKLPEVFTGVRSKKIVAVGRLSPQKNFALLLNAFAKFHVKHPEYILHFFGEGPLKEALTQQSKSLSIAEYVVFEGFVNDVAERIRDAAIYVSSSDYEGISNSMLEALAIGVPSICTDCSGGGAKIYIKSGENGFIVPVGNAEKLCEAMLELTETPGLAESFSHNSRKIVNEVGEDRICSMWKDIIDG